MSLIIEAYVYLENIGVFISYSSLVSRSNLWKATKQSQKEQQEKVQSF